MLQNMNRYQRNLYGGFAAGVSLGVCFALLVPQIWWVGLVGGALFGILVGKLFANDAKRDMEFEDQERRLSRRATPAETQIHSMPATSRRS